MSACIAEELHLLLRQCSRLRAYILGIAKDDRVSEFVGSELLYLGSRQVSSMSQKYPASNMRRAEGQGGLVFAAIDARHW